VHRQLANEIELRDGQRGLVLSASKEIEPGARAMLLVADRMFRLDVRVRGDSLQTFVRNLTEWPLELHGDAGRLGGTTTTFGEVGGYTPGRADLGFSLGSGDDLLMTRVTIATLRFADRGTIRVSAQAVVRQPSAISETGPDTA
jgi:hypothetical protein